VTKNNKFLSFVCLLEFLEILIFIRVDIFKHTAQKIRKLNEQIKFYLKCMVPPYSRLKNIKHTQTYK